MHILPCFLVNTLQNFFISFTFAFVLHVAQIYVYLLGKHSSQEQMISGKEIVFLEKLFT